MIVHILRIVKGKTCSQFLCEVTDAPRAAQGTPFSSALPGRIQRAAERSLAHDFACKVVCYTWFRLTRKGAARVPASTCSVAEECADGRGS